jgi:PRC-barrel domain
MPSVKRRASKIVNEFGAAQSELIGKAVVLTDGKAGTVENVWLDELHGLRISIAGHDGKWDFHRRSGWKMAGLNHQACGVLELASAAGCTGSCAPFKALQP